jgi:antitoxin component YwqK of YwqJK toxin-antitoxin module
MKTIIFITTVFLNLTVMNGQTESINKLNSYNKKDGKWSVYLDSEWNKVDSNKAIFVRYTWFDNGVNIHPMGAGGAKMEATSTTPKKVGLFTILDGEYKWYDKNGKLKYTHIFKDGEYESYKEFYPTGELQTLFDYTKKCEGQPHSWTIFIYDKNGNLIKTTGTCKDENGKWPKMRG